MTGMDESASANVAAEPGDMNAVGCTETPDTETLTMSTIHSAKIRGR